MSERLAPIHRDRADTGGSLRCVLPGRPDRLPTRPRQAPAAVRVPQLVRRTRP